MNRGGYKLSEETRRKMSESRKGSKHPMWTGGLPVCIDCGNKLSRYDAVRCRKCNNSFRVGENHGGWKGDKTKYGGKHMFIYRLLGKAFGCKLCGTKEKRKYHWANISGKYKRDASDWINLCVPCHSKFDKRRGE